MPQHYLTPQMMSQQLMQMGGVGQQGPAQPQTGRPVASNNDELIAAIRRLLMAGVTPFTMAGDTMAGDTPPGTPSGMPQGFNRGPSSL